MIYIEKLTKLNLIVEDSNEDIEISVTCLFQTQTSVSWYYLGPRNAICGENGVVGTGVSLKGRKRVYNGVANNPSGDKVTVIFKFKSTVDEITYVFPDDYSGDPDYDENDQNPDYKFYVNFI